MNTQNNKVQVSHLSVILLRVMVSLIFIVAGFNHLFHTDKALERIEEARLGMLAYILEPPEILVIASGIVMIIAATALLSGFKTHYAAIVLIAVLIPITLTIHVGQINTMGPLFKNVAILGGLIFFVINPKFKSISK